MVYLQADKEIYVRDMHVRYAAMNEGQKKIKESN